MFRHFLKKNMNKIKINIHTIGGPGGGRAVLPVEEGEERGPVAAGPGLSLLLAQHLPLLRQHLSLLPNCKIKPDKTREDKESTAQSRDYLYRWVVVKGGKERKKCRHVERIYGSIVFSQHEYN